MIIHLNCTRLGFPGNISCKGFAECECFSVARGNHSMIAAHTYHNVHLHQSGCSEGQGCKHHSYGHFPQRSENRESWCPTVNTFTCFSLLFKIFWKCGFIILSEGLFPHQCPPWPTLCRIISLLWLCIPKSGPIVKREFFLSIVTNSLLIGDHLIVRILALTLRSFTSLGCKLQKVSIF